VSTSLLFWPFSVAHELSWLTSVMFTNRRQSLPSRTEEFRVKLPIFAWVSMVILSQFLPNICLDRLC
jgi:hypothetical protein